MTLRDRLTLTIAGITALLTGPAVYGVSRLNQLADIARDQRATLGAAYLATGGLQTRLAQLDQRQRSHVAFPSDSSRTAMLEALDSVRSKLLELGNAGFPEYLLEASKRVDAIASATEHVDSLIMADMRDEATNYLADVRPRLFGEAQNTATEIAARIEVASAAALREADLINQTATTTTLLALFICVIVAIFIGARTTRALTRPVMRLQGAMAAVADGRFRIPDDLPYKQRDEIGSVSRSFRSMTHRLAELDRMKAEFMSIATHELKTPINVISGYAELLQERVYGDLNDRQDDALAAVRDQARILTTLVNQLLDISRLEAGGLRVQMREMQLKDFFLRIQRSFAPLAERKGIAFDLELDEELPHAIAGDADRLRDQVLGNIISNAVKFTPEGGRIVLRCRPIPEAVVIEVGDTGPGIPIDKLPHIFDKFYQVGDQARSKGAGLGLAIAREIVDAHGGNIAAESEPGRGTVFRIVLPMFHSVSSSAESAAVTTGAV
jgi:signal transduction histidine kinase